MSAPAGPAGEDRVPVVLVVEDVRPSGSLHYRIETKNGTPILLNLCCMTGETRAAIIAASVAAGADPDRAEWADDLLARVVARMNAMGGDAEGVALLAEYDMYKAAS